MLYFVALATIPLLGVVSFALVQMRSQTERQVISQLESVAELKEDQIDRWIATNALVLDSFLANPERRASLTSFAAATALDAAAQATIDTELHDLSGLGADTTGSYFHSFFLYNRAGSVLAASDPGDIGKVVVNQPYFASSIEAAYVQPPYYAVGNGALTMVLTRPLRDSSGQTVGVLVGQVNLDGLGKILLERTGLGASGETYLVSQESNYLLTPSRWPDYPLNRAYHSLGIDQALGGEQGAGIYEGYRTLQVLGSYRPIPTMHAALLAEIDVDEAQALFRQTAGLSIALAALTAVIAVLIGLFAATYVSRPITALVQTATQITDGALNQRATVVQRDEIGVLATVFNRMTDRLQHTLAGLEQRVAERTIDLERANAEAQQALADLRESIRERELLSATVRAIASPLLPVSKGILVMPLIGVIDTERILFMMEALLSAIESHEARIVIIDVTGVPVIDTQVAQALMQAADAARLLGALPILVGVRPELAQTIVGLGLDLNSLVTLADLQSGIGYALRDSNKGNYSARIRET